MPLALDSIPQKSGLQPSKSPAGRSTGESVPGRNLSDGAGQAGGNAWNEVAAGGPSAVTGIAPAAPGVSGAPFLARSGRGALRVAVASARLDDVADAAALGTYGSIVSASENAGSKSSSSSLVQRFFLQSAARRLLPMEGVAGCLRRRQAGRDMVDIWYTPETASAHYGGLQTCSSVWACPVCAAKISERRRVEVREAIDAWDNTKMPKMKNPKKMAGGDVALLTLTVQHVATDALPGLLAGLKDALRRCHQGREGQRFAAEFGVCGSISATELTWGEKSGFHPHIHMLLFVEPGCNFDLLLLHYRKQWARAVALAGLRPVNSHGVSMTWAKKDVADYVVKIGGWDLEHELTKQPVKKGREGRYSPLQLLAAYAACPEETDTETGEIGPSLFGRVWRNYAQSMKGRHQLQWSRGLRKRLGLAVEKTDEALAEETEKTAVNLYQPDKKEWATVLHFDKRAELLNVAASGSAGAVKDFLVDLDWLLTKDAEERILLSVQPRRLSDELRQLAILDEEADIICKLRECDAAEMGLTPEEYDQWRRGRPMVQGGGKWVPSLLI